MYVHRLLRIVCAGLNKSFWANVVFLQNSIFYRFRAHFFCLVLAFILLLPSFVMGQWATDSRFSAPINCTDLNLCFVQNYVDLDPSIHWADYMCRHLSYDGHTGTDIRVLYEDMQRGVPVLAMDDGRVMDVRDGMEDGTGVMDLAALHGKFAGNAVYVNHNNGFAVQYNHLKKASVRVKKGDFVQRGQVLGMVGLSGKTEFPHLEICVFAGKKSVDPFMGDTVQSCGQHGMPLWDKAALNMFPYKSRGKLDAAFVNGVPDLRKVLLSPKKKFDPQRSDRMSFWAAFFGVVTGDELYMSVMNPAGRIIAEHSIVAEKNFAQKSMFVSIRKRRNWPAGRYRGICVLTPVETNAPPVTIVREITVPKL